MKIIYSPFYDNDPYIGDAPKEMGTTYVGNLGLLSQLQLRAGIHPVPKSDVEREADYLNAMQKHSTGKFFAAAAKVDPIGTAGKLLQWRDALVMAGWDGKCNDPNAKKVQTLAEIEQDFRSIGIADCWKAVCEKYSKGVSLAGEVQSIRVETAKAELPCLIQRTLDAININGVEVSYTLNGDIKTPRLAPAKIKYVEFDDLNEAYEWFAQVVNKLPKGTVVVNRDNARLNHTLYTWDRPLAHSSLRDSNPQLLQLFKLSMSIFSRPLNINNLVSYLLLPMSPIPGGLRRQLAKQLMAHGGFGDEIIRADGKVRDDWDEIIEAFPFRGKDGNDSPQAIGKAKAKKMPFLTPIRKDYSNGISKSDIIDYVKDLQEWVRGHYADEELPAGIKAQLRELSDYLSSFNTALESLPEKIIYYSQIEKLILRIYRPMNYSLQNAQAGSANIVNNVRAIASEAETLLWLDCQEDDIEKDQYDFLSAAEREYLEKHNCSLPDFSEHLQTCRKEKLLAMNKCKSIILVRSKYDGTARLGEHPMVAEARYEYKKTAEKELLPTDPSKLFTAVSPTSVTKDIEKFQAVNYLDLGNIDYPGRKESNSSLDSLIQLPFNYLMQYVAKLPVPDDEQLNNLYITTGLVAHHFFEHVTKDALAAGSSQPLANMKRLVNGEFDKRLEAAIDATGLIMRLQENSSELEQFRTQLKDSILALIEIMQKKGWTPVGCEMEFPQSGSLCLDKIGDFGARIDYLAKDNDDNYVIIDFKWSYGNKYEEHLKANTAIQLELYRQAVLETYKGKTVAGVAYYLMPRKLLLTTDFNEIPNSRLIRHIDKDNSNNLFVQIQNSYEFRMGEIRQGHIEEAEMMVVSGDKNGYYDNITSQDLCPLNADEKYDGRGRNRVFNCAIKKSEQIFRKKKRQTFDDPNAEPSEKATSHPILKGRLK